jgi:hypothetical protein
MHLPARFTALAASILILAPRLDIANRVYLAS